MLMNRLIPLSAAILSATMLMPLSAQAAVDDSTSIPTGESAVQVLSTLTVADQTDEPSDRKGMRWADSADGRHASYNTRDLILDRDMSGTTHKDNGRVATGTLDPDPYTGGTIHFTQGQPNKTEGGSASATDGGVQIDHVVAYAEAYNSGLKDRDESVRKAYYNDPDVLLAVQSQANNAKKDADAAGWMPSWSAFGCDYAALQIGIKAKYSLTVDQKEHDALASTLGSCPTQQVVSTSQVKSLASALKSGASTGGDGKPAAPKYSVDDLKSIRFTATPRRGDYRSDELDFGADTAVGIDRSSLPEGWTVREDAVNCPLAPSTDGRRICPITYDVTSYVTAPDGTAVKTYRLHSTPFLDTTMTVAGAAASDGKATLPRAAFDRLSASDLKVTDAPELDGLTTEPSVAANADGSKTAQVLFVRNDVIVWKLAVTVSASGYSVDDLKSIRFTATPRKGDYRSDTLDFDVDRNVSVDKTSLPQGWTVRETPSVPAQTVEGDGLIISPLIRYTTSRVSAPDGTVVKTYRLRSTPFLGVVMTVAGVTASENGITLPRSAFDGLSASDLKATGMPDLDGLTTKPSVTDNADGTKTARILFVQDNVVVWKMAVTVSASEYSADDLKGLRLLVDGKAWDGSDLADPSALTWSGLPDGWTVSDSTADGIRTLAFTAPDGTVVRTVHVGALHDADKPKTDGAAKTAADTEDTPAPLASTGVGAKGALILSATLMLAAGIGLAFVSRRRE